MLENKKYDFRTDEERGLLQIIPTRKIRIKQLDTIIFPNSDTHEEVGGFIKSSSSLSQDGNCWIYENSVVDGSLSKVVDDAVIYGASIIFNSYISNTAKINGSMIKNSRVSHNAIVNHTILENAIIGPNALIEGQYDYTTIIYEKFISTRSLISIYHMQNDKYMCMYNNDGSDIFENTDDFQYIEIDPINGKFDEIMKNRYGYISSTYALLYDIRSTVDKMRKLRANMIHVDTELKATRRILDAKLKKYYAISLIG